MPRINRDRINGRPNAELFDFIIGPPWGVVDAAGRGGRLADGPFIMQASCTVIPNSYRCADGISRAAGIYLRDVWRRRKFGPYIF